MKLLSRIARALCRAVGVASQNASGAATEGCPSHLGQNDGAWDLLERDRKWLAHELHDGLCQQLTLLRLQLQRLSRIVGDLGPEEVRAKALTHIWDIETSVAGALSDVRRTISDLRPGVLDDLGLVPALEYWISTFQDQTGISCDLTTGTPELLLPEPSCTHVFRIVQEALSNVARHANATHATVVISVDARDYVVRITDDGIGIPDNALGGTGSQGMSGMRARAGALNGSVEFVRLPTGGTSVTLVFPRK